MLNANNCFAFDVQLYSTIVESKLKDSPVMQAELSNFLQSVVCDSAEHLIEEFNKSKNKQQVVDDLLPTMEWIKDWLEDFNNYPEMDGVLSNVYLCNKQKALFFDFTPDNNPSEVHHLMVDMKAVFYEFIMLSNLV